MKRVWTLALIAVLAAVAIALSYFAQFYWLKDGWPLTGSESGNRAVNISPVSQVLISEVMSSNKTAYAGVGGLYCDWVEIYNSGDKPCDITGWTLTDNAKSVVSFTFPERTLAGGEFVIVYLTGKLVNEPGVEYQAPFKLSSQGDALMLYDRGGSIMESVSIPALPTDTAYARIGSTGEFIVTKLYTPGLINTNDSYRALSRSEQKSDIPLSITRIMPSNKSYLKNPSGGYQDWVEIGNASDSPINLEGYMLSDDIFERGKWIFPSMTIAPGERITIFCTGVSGETTAGFRLSAKGESVVLCDPQGRVIDSVDYGYSLPDQLWVRQLDGTLK